MKKLILCAAITGGGPARSARHPVTPDALVADALACWRSGASMIHFHARTPEGAATADRRHYRAIIETIRAQGCDAVLNVSAGDNGGMASHAERLAVIDAGSEIVSLTVSSYNSGGRLYDNRPSFVAEMARGMMECGVRPEIEIMDTGFLSRLADLVASGMLRRPLHCLFAFGLNGGMRPDARLLPLLLEQLPEGAEWTVAAPTSRHEDHLALLMQAFVQGGHIRTGLEDVSSPDLPSSNLELVEQWVKTASIWGRPIASPSETRGMLGLEPFSAREAA